jgi:hypothetical protein
MDISKNVDVHHCAATFCLVSLHHHPSPHHLFMTSVKQHTSAYELIPDMLIRYLKSLLADRFLNSTVTDQKIVITYKTKGGYYVRASYCYNGVCIKRYYKEYNSYTESVSGYLFRKLFVFE